jgi:cation diffusion facilitator family transporter
VLSVLLPVAERRSTYTPNEARQDRRAEYASPGTLSMDGTARGPELLTRLLPFRSSTAALRSASATEGIRVVVVALGANLVVAAAKLAAGLLTGSAALLAEAGHSLADSLNEVFLAVSLRRGNVPADLAHPLGHGRERFLWAFMAAIASFLIGGCLSIALGIQKLLAGGSESNLLVAWVVIAIALAAEGVSLLQSLRSLLREAEDRHESLWRCVVTSSDPTLRAVIVEDSAALVGLALAAIGLAASAVLGDGWPDAVASILIGLLLAATAFGLAWPLSDFLVGRSVTVEELGQMYAVLAASPAVEEVLALQAVYTGPDQVIVGAKVRPVSTLTIPELTRAMDEVDHAMREAFPPVADVFVDVTAFRKHHT